MTTTRSTGDPSAGRRRSPVAAAAWWATAFLLGVAVIGVVALTLGTATGWLSIQTVPTGSMEPAITRGSAIVVDPIAVGDVAVDDVIVFAAPETGRMTVHRVVGIEEQDGQRVFITKGDANEAPDPWRLLPEQDHVHEVRYAVPGVGQVLLTLSSPWARMALAGVGGALVLGFGLTHMWRSEPAEQDAGEPVHAYETWHGALDRLVAPLHHHHHEPHEHHEHHEHQTVGEAVDAAEARRLDSFEELLLAADPAPEGSRENAPAPVDDRGRSLGGTTLVVLVAAAVAGAAILVPTRVASAAFNTTTTAAGTVSTLTVPAKTAVGCSWNTATNVTVSWTNPNPTDSAQVLVANTSGGTTSVGATALAGATSVAYTPVAPLTTVRYLSTQAVDGTWTSPASPEMPTNTCRRAVNAYAGNGTAGFAGDGGAATAASLNAPLQSFEAPDGRVFVADSANNRIRVISTGGVISTFAGGTGAAQRLHLRRPAGLAADERPSRRGRRRGRQRLHRRHRRRLHPQGRHRRQRHPVRRRRGDDHLQHRRGRDRAVAVEPLGSGGRLHRGR